MSKTKYEQGVDRRHRGLVITVIISAFFLAILIFLFIFRITKVEISGNHHYTDQEIENMVFQGPLSQNSVFLSLTNQHKKIKSADFIDTLTVDMESPRTIRIEVIEKKLVGYVQYDNAYWYFDKDGMVLVRSDKNESDYASLMAGQSAVTTEISVQSAAAGTAVITPEAITIDAGTGDIITPVPAEDSSVIQPQETVSSADSAGSESGGQDSMADSQAASDSAADSSALESTADSASASDSTAASSAASVSPSAASDASQKTESAVDSAETSKNESGSSGNGVTPSEKEDFDYIPFVEGLTFSSAAIGEILPVADPNVFSVLSSLKNIINKNQIIPDGVDFSEDGNLLLTYGTAQVNLGTGDHLEVRLEELTGILPSLQGLSGILHLENFDGTQERLIFDKK